MSVAFDLHRAIDEVLRKDERNPQSARELYSYLMDLLYYADFRIIEQIASFSDDDHTNLIGIRGQGAGGLLLCSAISDGGPLKTSDWSETEEDPFNPTYRGDLLFARGATGGKVDLVCKILAASNIDASEYRRPVTVAGFFGADSRVGGAMHFLDSGICNPEWALVGEATALELVSAHRGYLVFSMDFELPTEEPVHEDGCTYRIEVQGEAAHSAIPGYGRNALSQAIQLLTQFHTAGIPFVTYQLTAPMRPGCIPHSCTLIVHSPRKDWIPAGRHITVERIPNPSSPLPTIDAVLQTWRAFEDRLYELFRWDSPEWEHGFLPAIPLYSLLGAASANGVLRVHFDYRPLPGERGDAIVRDAEALARHTFASALAPTSQVERNLLPMETDQNGPFLLQCKEALRECGIPPVVNTYSGHVEGWIFDAAQIETVVFGPGPILQNAFRPNEYTLTQHLSRATAFYERVIRKLCT